MGTASRSLGGSTRPVRNRHVWRILKFTGSKNDRRTFCRCDNLSDASIFTGARGETSDSDTLSIQRLRGASPTFLYQILFSSTSFNDYRRYFYIEMKRVGHERPVTGLSRKPRYRKGTAKCRRRIWISLASQQHHPNCSKSKQIPLGHLKVRTVTL